MLTLQSSFFENPMFIQKMMKKKSSKYNIRPLYTSDMVSDVLPDEECYLMHNATRSATSRSYTSEFSKKIKTYNQPLIYHSKSHSSVIYCNKNSPTVSPSSSIASSSESSVVPPHSIHQYKKRPFNSKVLLEIMDQYLLKKQQRQQSLESSFAAIHMNRSGTVTVDLGMLQQRLDRDLSYTSTRCGSARQHQEYTMKKTARNVAPKPICSQRQATEWPYVLVQGNEEQDRMVAQHYLLRTAFGSDFFSPIKSQLRKGMIVLDVGCGPGTWTMEMATAFPKSTFIGIDQSAFFPKDIKPRNCHFRTCGQLTQQQLPLPFPDNSIDYIYQRDMNWGLMGQTWQALLQEYLRVLKPGGWIEVVEQDLEAQSSPEDGCSINDELIKGLCLRMQDPYAVHRLPTMLLYNGFENIEAISRSCPLGWGEDQMSNRSNISESSTDAGNASDIKEEAPKCSEFSRAMSSQHLLLLKALRPWLSTAMDLNDKKYDDYIAGLPAQWCRAKTYINWHCFTAQKPCYIKSL